MKRKTKHFKMTKQIKLKKQKSRKKFDNIKKKKDNQEACKNKIKICVKKYIKVQRL